MKQIRVFSSTEIRDAVFKAVDYAILCKTEGVGIGMRHEVWRPDYSVPFYIDVRGTVTFEAVEGLQMSSDRENWSDTVAGDLPIGKTYFRVASDQTNPILPVWTEDENSDYDIGGNINSLVKVNFENDTVCYTFSNAFANKHKLKSAGRLILPATTLAVACYGFMFYNCTSLTQAPELPATTLAQSCYAYMFGWCNSLSNSPSLPATTLAQSCYYEMFYRCTSLTIAPALPATTLAEYCYCKMFSCCTLLTIAPALPATTLTKYCYSEMFSGCESLTHAPELPATTLVLSCYYTMFYGCTSLVQAPDLPATTLVDDCYYYMFSNCTNLNYIKCLATDISATYCTQNWVSGVSPTGTFVKNASTEWTTSTNGIPSGWTVEEI